MAQVWLVYVDTRDKNGEVVQRPDGYFLSAKSAQLRKNRINNHPDKYPNQVAWVELEERALGGSGYKASKQNGMAKLTWTDVNEIRRRHADGERVMDLAAEFNVTRRTISMIVNNQSWASERKPKEQPNTKAEVEDE